jgi:hypothetical protein
LWCGSPDNFKALRNRRAFPQSDLFLQQQVDEVEVAHLRSLGAGHLVGDGVAEVGEPEPGGVVADPVSGQGAHVFSFMLVPVTLAAWA